MPTVRAFMIFVVGTLVGLASPHFIATLIAPSPVENTPDSLKIGALLCLTGECAEWGTEALNGAKLAVEELNAKGGVLGKSIELVIEDSKDTTPRETVTAFKSLLTHKNLHYVVGPTWTPAGLAIAPLAKVRSDLIVTSPSLGVEAFDHAGNNLFNLWPHDETRARLLAKTAFERGFKRVAIFSSQQPWSKHIGDVFESEAKQYGMEVIAKTEPLDSEKNLRADALRIAERKPDLIFFSVIGEQAGIGAREFLRLNSRAQLMIVMLDQTTKDVALGALEGVISTEYPSPSTEFSQRYEKRFGRAPRVSADTGYDTIMVYALSIKNAGTTNPLHVLPTLQSLKNYPGASGDITFDAHGGLSKEPYLVRLEGKVSRKG